MALVSKNQVETNVYELVFSVDAETFENAVRTAFKKEAPKMTVPGFRKGKAPRNIIEKMYGMEVFYEEAVHIVYPDAYKEAVDAAEITPVDRADVEINTIGKEGVEIKVKVTVKPEVEIGEYKALEVEKSVKTVDDEELNKEIERVRERSGRIVTIEDRAILNGDIANINYEGFMDGVPFDGGKDENYDLKIGSGRFIPGFEDQLIGKNTGDEVDVNVTFPDEYHAEELKGKPVVFKVKINEIKMMELPELDDEFAKDVSDFDTFEEYKKDVRDKLQAGFDKQMEAIFENNIIEKLLENFNAEIPSVMIEDETVRELNNFAYGMAMRGIDMKNYLKYTGQEIEEMRENFREPAERNVKTRLALEKVGMLEDPEISAEQLEEKYKEITEQSGETLEKIKQTFSDNDIKGDILSARGMEFLKKTAVVTEVPYVPSAKDDIDIDDDEYDDNEFEFISDELDELEALDEAPSEN